MFISVVMRMTDTPRRTNGSRLGDRLSTMLRMMTTISTGTLCNHPLLESHQFS